MNNKNIKKLLVLSALAAVSVPCVVALSKSNNSEVIALNRAKKEVVPAESISIDKKEVSVEEGLNVVLKCTVLPENATNKKVYWSSVDTSIATVSPSGVVCGVKEGVTTVKATHEDGWTSKCSVTVTKAKEKEKHDFINVSLDKTELSMEKGEEKTLVATLTPDYLEDKTLTWNSTNPSVAVVDGNGKVTAIHSGECKIIVSHGLFSAECNVTVASEEVIFEDLGKISITNQVVSEYMSLQTNKEQYDFLKEHTNTSTSDPENDYQDFVMTWNDDSSSYYHVVIAQNENLDKPLVDKLVENNEFSYGMFTPGETYYARVYSEFDDVLLSEKFTVSDNEVRFVNVPNAKNIRDFGGWSTPEGNINYKLLYRGGCLNGKGAGKLNSDGIKMFNNDLKIKTEMDFRAYNSDSSGYQTNAYFNVDANYKTINFNERRFENVVLDNSLKPVIKDYFETLADKNNYPMYMHCNEGASRTGTAAFLAEAVLGVSYEDMVRDYELTNFSQSGSRRWRTHAYNDEVGFEDLRSLTFEELKSKTPNPSTGRSDCGYNIDALYVYLMENYKGEGTTIQDAAVNYIKSCGVTQETINNFKYIMFTDGVYEEVTREKSAEDKSLVFVTLKGLEGGEDVITPVQKGKKLTISSPTRDKMVFDGWYLGDEIFDLNTPITEAITLVAHWKEYSDTPTDNKITVVEMTKDLFTSIAGKFGKTSVSGDAIELYEVNTNTVVFDLPKINYSNYKIVEFDYLNNWSKAHLSLGTANNQVQFGQTNERYRYTIRIDCETGKTYVSKIVNFSNNTVVSDSLTEIGYTLNRKQLMGYESLSLGWDYVSGTNKGFKLASIFTYNA